MELLADESANCTFEDWTSADAKFTPALRSNIGSKLVVVAETREITATTKVACDALRFCHQLGFLFGMVLLGLKCEDIVGQHLLNTDDVRSALKLLFDWLSAA